jgi:cobalt/nickel transport system permease protein
MELPQWMRTRARPEPARCQWSRFHPSPRFLHRALGSFARLFEALLTNERTASAPGLLQSLDARAKTLGLTGLIVLATLLQRSGSLVMLLLLSIILAFASRLPLRQVARVWLVVPLFSLAIITPAILNIITPGTPLVTLWTFSRSHLGPWALPEALTITAPGLMLAFRFLLRVTVCVTLAYLLTATTRPDRLFQGLRALSAPRLFILLLGMMQRYLTVLLRSAQEIHLARLSRSANLGSTRQEQAWIAAGIGALFRKTHTLGEEVFHAMLSRGFTGEIKLLAQPRWTLQEWSFLLGIACLAFWVVQLG